MQSNFFVILFLAGFASPTTVLSHTVGGIGALCIQGSDCEGFPESSFCLIGRCTCRFEYLTESKTSCLFVRHNLGDECSDDIQCNSASLGGVHSKCVNSVCACCPLAKPSPDGKCYLKSDFGFGQSCSDDQTCQVSLGEHGTCVGSECTCKDNSLYDSRSSKCLLVVPGSGLLPRSHQPTKVNSVGESCDTDVTCVANLHLAVCAENKRCECMEGTVLDGGKCVFQASNESNQVL